MQKKCSLRKIIMLLLCLSFIILPQHNTAFAATVVGVPQVCGITSTSTTASITWKKSENAKKYEIYRAESKTGKYKKIATTSKTTVTDKGLTPNRYYYYKLRAVNGQTYSKYSSIKKITTKKDSYDLTRYAGKNFLNYVKSRNIPYKYAGSDGSFETKYKYYVMATSPSLPESSRIIDSIWISGYINKPSKYSICGVKIGMSMKSAKSTMSKAAGWRLEGESEGFARYLDGAGNRIMINVSNDDHRKVGVVSYSLNH